MFPGDVTDTGEFIARGCLPLNLTAGEKLLHLPSELMGMTASVLSNLLKGFEMVFYFVLFCLVF